jgi:nucleoside phosphorylase
VGVCSGVPDGGDHNQKAVLLGDVVISTSIVQYDFGCRWPGRFNWKDTLDNSLGRPNLEIQGFLAKLQAWTGTKKLRYNIMRYLAVLLEKADFEESRYPGPDRDKLFQAAYRYKHHQSKGHHTPCTDCNKGKDNICENALRSFCSVLGCDETWLVYHKRLVKATEALESPNPAINYGRIGSGDTVIRSGEDCDEIARIEEVIAFEMEGALIWDSFPYIIKKWISDYADSHKSKEWQAYAAATAASYMKSFLDEWTSNTQTQYMSISGT